MCIGPAAERAVTWRIVGVARDDMTCAYVECVGGRGLWGWGKR